MSEQMVVAENVMSDEEFAQARPRMIEIFLNLKKVAIEAMKLLARMSRNQLRKVKEDLNNNSCFVSGDFINRLAAGGRGEFPPYLAIRTKSLSLSVWRSLPSKAKEILSNPKSIITFIDENGQSKTTQAEMMTPVQIKMAFDKNGYIQPRNQFLNKFSPPVPTPNIAQLDSRAEDFSKLHPVIGKDYMLIEGVNGSIVRVPFKTLRRCIQK